MMLFGSAGFNSGVAKDRKSYGVGIQLYSIRDAMSADVPGTLKKVSDIGYKNLELASYSEGKFYGYSPAEFRKMVSDLGMVALSSHSQVESAGITMDKAKLMADAHAELGVKYCIKPWIEEVDRNIEQYKKMIKDCNEVGKIMKGAGVQFGYHNHNFEFKNINGVVPYYDIFLPEMDSDLITMELDLFWASKAGQDPIAMFKKYPGRFQLLHFKDMRTNQAPFFEVVKDDICSVGEGVIDFKKILTAKKTAGMKYLFVEDDNQGNGKPFEGIDISIKNITTKILT
jgi:sugar phosphate isomerase/epimerase